MDQIAYEIKSSSKARHMRIAIYPNCKVVVTKPNRVPAAMAKEFVDRKSSWILKKLNYFRQRQVTPFSEVRSKNRAEALELVKSRIEYYNQHYGFKFGNVSIKDHKSLWGSCSIRGNLNFNHKIVELPAAQADYIIVHELCHLKEFNHSIKFWNLVAETIPEFQKIKQELKTYSFY